MEAAAVARSPGGVHAELHKIIKSISRGSWIDPNEKKSLAKTCRNSTNEKGLSDMASTERRFIFSHGEPS